MNKMVTVDLKKIRFLSLLIPWYEIMPRFSPFTHKKNVAYFFTAELFYIFGPVIKNIHMVGSIELNTHKCVCLRQTV